MRRMTIFRSELTLALTVIAVPLSVAAQQPPAVQRPIQQAQEAGQAPPPLQIGPHSGTPPPNQQPGAVRQQPAAPSGQQPAPAAAPQGGAFPQSPAPAPGGAFPQNPNSAAPSGGALPQSGTPVVPATHTVVQGETLWALARQYFGDALLWPEIYRLNTNIVEDPHWIYPGEELRLTATEDTAAAPSTGQSYLVNPAPDTVASEPAPAPYVSPTTGPTIFSPQGPRARTATALERLAARSYRAVRDGEYYSTGFLTENQTLPTGRIIGDVKTSSRTGSQMAVHLYDDVIVSAPPNDSLEQGNLLLAFRRGDEVGDYGEIVLPTALLRVGASEEAGHYRATVIRMFATVNVDQELLDIQPFSLGNSQHAVAIAGGVTGQVIRMRDPHELSQRQQVLFIDKGANDGLRPGDLIQIYRNRTDEVHGGSIEQDLARGVIVNTRASTSTVLIVELYSGDVGPASLVRQIGRIPS
jgi:LysM repeat protein